MTGQSRGSADRSNENLTEGSASPTVDRSTPGSTPRTSRGSTTGAEPVRGADRPTRHDRGQLAAHARSTAGATHPQRHRGDRPLSAPWDRPGKPSRANARPQRPGTSARPRGPGHGLRPPQNSATLDVEPALPCLHPIRNRLATSGASLERFVRQTSTRRIARYTHPATGNMCLTY